MASFSRRLVMDMGATGIRLGEVVPDGKGAPVLSFVRTVELAIDPSKAAEIFPAWMQAVPALFKESGLKPGPTILCLGGPAVFSRVIKVPAAEPDRVAQMIGFEAQQTVPAIEAALWDSQIFPGAGEGELEAMLVAMKKESVDEACVTLASSKMVVETAELAPTALINCFRYNYPEATGCNLILEIGARATSIILLEGSKIFCRVVPLGGASVTQAIATDMQESFPGAEVLKKAKGFVHPGGAYENPADEATGRIAKLARGVMTKLHTEIERSITFYRSQQSGAKPSAVYLTGGGAQLGLTDLFFQEKLRVPVHYLQPLRRFSLGGRVNAGEVASSLPVLACLAGSALQVLPESPCRVNLFNSQKNADFETAKNRPAMIALVAAGCGLALLPGGHFMLQAGKIRGTLADQAVKVESAERVLNQLETEQKKAEKTVAAANRVVQLNAERDRWPLLLGELKKHSVPGLWVTRLEIMSTPEAPSETPGKPKSAAVPEVEIAGLFETKSEESDSSLLENFREKLNQGGVLQNVRTIEREIPDKASGETDQVALKFLLKAEWPLKKIESPAAKAPAK